MLSDAPHRWTFLSNHAHVLVCVSRDEAPRVREIAAAVGITERAVQRILGELEEAGVIERQREGRRTAYAINRQAFLRHPLEADHTVGELLRALTRPRGGPSEKRRTKSRLRRRS